MIKVEVPPLEYVITIDHVDLVRIARLIDGQSGVSAVACDFWQALPEDVRAEVRRMKGFF